MEKIFPNEWLIYFKYESEKARSVSIARKTFIGFCNKLYASNGTLTGDYYGTEERVSYKIYEQDFYSFPSQAIRTIGILNELEIKMQENGDKFIRLSNNKLNNSPYMIFIEKHSQEEVGLSIQTYGLYTKARDSLYEKATNRGDELLSPYRGKGEKIKIKFGKCGHEEWKEAGNYKRGNGCTICLNQTVVKGVNDVATTHSELTKYFANVSDSQAISYGYSGYIDSKCPLCNHVTSKRFDHVRNGFSCEVCSDGISYPEKFMTSVLMQLKDYGDISDFNVQMNNRDETWCGDKRYDFYIKDLNTIIETHGSQHYNDSFRPLNIEQENDRFKKLLAMLWGIDNYIVIDCSKSDKAFIRNNIVNSKLGNMFDLTKIDWDKCNDFALSSYIRRTCDLWNDMGKPLPKDLSPIIGFSEGTVRKYLKIGAKCGLCDYKGHKPKQ